MDMLKKKVPPPPKQPGTHTNAEVKEALHARALRRTIVITAVVILLLAALAVVSSTAQEYQGQDDTKHYPKAIIIVAEGLTPYTWNRSILSNKAPFTRLINNSGGIFTTLGASFPADAEIPATQRNTTNLVRLLTGSTAASVKPTLNGATSFLRTLKEKCKPVVLAPATYWSSNQIDNVDNACARVGFFDAECTGTSCPKADKEAYCNAFRKYVACSGGAELYTDDIIRVFNETLKLGTDLLYVQLANFDNEENREATIGNVMKKRSEVNLLDGTVGRIALALAERTRFMQENWLIIVTSEGANTKGTAPLLMAAYSDGQMIQLKRPTTDQGLMITDIRGTLLKWFGVESSAESHDRLIGLCSDGTNVANCNGTSTSA